MAEEKKDEKKPEDILESIKKLEKQVKARMLLEILTEIKTMAKDVLKFKEKTSILLEELGIKAKDIKRVIDFINSLPEVVLTEAEKKELREKTKDKVKEARKNAEEKIKKSPLVSSYQPGSTVDAVCAANTTSANLAASDILNLSSGTDKISLGY